MGQSEKQLTSLERLEEKGGVAYRSKGLQKDWKQKGEITFFVLNLVSS